jgi:hypothetical protein
MKHVFIILTFVSTTVFAQNDEAAVRQAVNRLFEGMKRSDTTMIRSAFSIHPILQTIRKSKEGQVTAESEPLDSFLLTVSQPHSRIYDERITFDVVKIDGELATVWAPYKFYLGENFSHCGVDSFQLIKTESGWKIQYLIDTRRRQDCE